MPHAPGRSRAIAEIERPQSTAKGRWTDAPLIRLRHTRSGTGTEATHAPKAKKAKQSLFDDPAFAHGYRAAYSAVYDRTDYASAIEQLKALGHDDHPNVANLIGYSYRKLGDYKLLQVWYERALKADPNHVRPGNITVCGRSSRATASRRNII